MKRNFAKLLAVLFLLQFFILSGGMKTNADTGSDISVSSYTVSSESINGGDSFSVNLNVKNTGSTDMGYVNFRIDNSRSSAFSMSGGSSVKLCDSLKSGAVASNTIGFTYNGGGDTQIYFQLVYMGSDGNEHSVDKSIGVNTNSTSTIVPTTGSTDTRRFAPKVTVVSGNSPTVMAGNSTSIQLTVKNSGLQPALNITVTPSVDSSDDSISLDNINSSRDISILAPGATASMSFQVNTDISATGKKYPVKFDISYINTAGDTFTSQSTVNIKVVNPPQNAPSIDISRVNFEPDSVDPGGTTKAYITLRNNGAASLSGIKLYLTSAKSDVVAIKSGTNKIKVADLDSHQETTLSYTLKAAKNAAEGNYGFTAKVEASDQSGRSLSDEQTFYLSVSRDGADDSIIVLDDFKMPDTALKAGDYFGVSFTAMNTGNSDIKNARITAAPDAAITLRSASTRVITKLSPNKPVPVSYFFMVPKGTANKNYPIQITAEFDDNVAGQVVKRTTNQTVNVYVGTNTDDSKSTPKIIIDKYSINPTIPLAGTNIKLNLSFLNTNSVKDIRNIKVYLSSSNTEGQTDSGSVFVPVNSSNTFYIDRIAPKSRAEKNIELYVVNDAKPKTYNLAANFEYEDSNGKELKATEYIGVPVRPQAKLDTSDFSLPQQVMLTDPLSVSFDIYNTGKSMLRNVMIKSTGNFDVQSQNSFIGNLDSGAQDHYEASIMPKAPGILKGSVIITFEDEAGQKQTIKKDISTNVQNPPPAPVNAQPIQKNSNKKKIIIGAAIGGAVIIAGVITYIIIRKKKKKKNEEMISIE